jgi:curved DNA-binding protein CbpA
MDYYSILELNPKEATPVRIKKQFHTLSLKTHPDKHPELDADIFRKIKEAYDILSDPITKKEYDESLLISSQPQPSSQPREWFGNGQPQSYIFVPPIKVHLTLFTTQLGGYVNIKYKILIDNHPSFTEYYLYIPPFTMEKNMIVVPNIGNQYLQKWGNIHGNVHFIIQKIIDPIALERERDKQRQQFEAILQARRLQEKGVRTYVRSSNNYLMQKKYNIRMNTMNEKFSRYNLYQTIHRTV